MLLTVGTCSNPKITLFLRQTFRMKKALNILLLTITGYVPPNNEVGPEGYKLIWFIIIIIIAFIAVSAIVGTEKTKGNIKDIFKQRKKIEVNLKKDRLYYPDILELTITNTGSSDLDIDKPLLVFGSFWLKRKFVLKGTNNYYLYPLFLGRGQSHKLNIDLNRFYLHDKSLKRLPRAKVIVYEVKGKRLGSCQVLLRKTLFGF